MVVHILTKSFGYNSRFTNNRSTVITGSKGTICLRLQKSPAFYQNCVKIHMVVPQSILYVGSTILFLNNVILRLYRAICKPGFFVIQGQRALWKLGFPGHCRRVQRYINMSNEGIQSRHQNAYQYYHHYSFLSYWE